jgi:predicted PurR-regulated permease PerM
MATPIRDPRDTRDDRRRTERRVNSRLMDLTLPEFRRMLLTTTIFVIVLVLFLWMVRTVIIATILGLVVAAYIRPLYRRMERVVGPATAATFALLLIIVPLLALFTYSYIEIKDVATYIGQHQDEIAAKIDASIRRLPFMSAVDTRESVRQYVVQASNYGTRVPGALRGALSDFAIAATVFIFTAFYVLIDVEKISEYLRSKIPPRYAELAGALEMNVRGVMYGAVYSTFLTQTLKSAILLVLFLLFQVPLAAVLAMASFIIGFFPVVGSWSIYLPVSLWLLVFRDSPGQALALFAIGMLVNTVYISTYLRPKIAAEKSKVLNFYWMLVGLVTGVYTFGLVGVILGPIVISLLKAIIDTITTTSSWRRVLDENDAPDGVTADEPA